MSEQKIEKRRVFRVFGSKLNENKVNKGKNSNNF